MMDSLRAPVARRRRRSLRSGWCRRRREVGVERYEQGCERRPRDLHAGTERAAERLRQSGGRLRRNDGRGDPVGRVEGVPDDRAERILQAGQRVRRRLRRLRVHGRRCGDEAEGGKQGMNFHRSVLQIAGRSRT